MLGGNLHYCTKWYAILYVHKLYIFFLLYLFLLTEKLSCFQCFEKVCRITCFSTCTHTHHKICFNTVVPVHTNIHLKTIPVLMQTQRHKHTPQNIFSTLLVQTQTHTRKLFLNLQTHPRHFCIVWIYLIDEYYKKVIFRYIFIPLLCIPYLIKRMFGHMCQVSVPVFYLVPLKIFLNLSCFSSLYL